MRLTLDNRVLACNHSVTVTLSLVTTLLKPNIFKGCVPNDMCSKQRPPSLTTTGVCMKTPLTKLSCLSRFSVCSLCLDSFMNLSQRIDWDSDCAKEVLFCIAQSPVAESIRICD